MLEIPETFDQKHMMIDLETLSCETNAVITQIGAVVFIPKTGEIVSKHCWNIDFARLGEEFHINAETVKWWFEQDPEIIKEMLKDPVPLEEALRDLAKINTFNRQIKGWWASNKSFDFPILHKAYKLKGVYSGIRRRDEYDLRDAKLYGSYKGVKGVKIIGHHNALADCVRQVEILHEMHKKMFNL